MNNLKLKYIEEANNDKDVSCIARMIVKRKKDLSKVINKRVQDTHQKKVLLKGTRYEVKQKFDKRPETSFCVW